MSSCRGYGAAVAASAAPRIADMNEKSEGKVVMLISSSGGHMVQLARAVAMLDATDKVLVTTCQRDEIPTNFTDIRRFYTVSDCNRAQPVATAMLFWTAYRILRSERPSVLISTGAAPGLIFFLIARCTTRARLLWIDSLANAKKPSLSGRAARYIAHVCLSQWEDVAAKYKMNYWGNVL